MFLLDNSFEYQFVGKPLFIDRSDKWGKRIDISFRIVQMSSLMK